MLLNYGVKNTDENSLNTNLIENEDDDGDFPRDNSRYSLNYPHLRLNPSQYAALQHYLSKRIRGSEFLGKRMGSEFLGKRMGSEFLGKRMGSEFLGRRRRNVAKV